MSFEITNTHFPTIVSANTSEEQSEIEVNQINWEDIIKEKETLYANVNAYLESCNPYDTTPPNPELKYLNTEVFPILLPIIEKTLFKAIRMECIKHQKSLFNGIDYISENLWLKNPIYPERENSKLNIFLMPWVNEWLKDHPRPIFPKSWIWTKEQASVIIQAYMRGHFVRKQTDVQEMRQFWKTLAREKELFGEDG